MDIFPVEFPNPDKGLQPKTEENVLENNFGDGYAQRVQVGINYQKRKLSLKWSTLNEETYKALEKWLRERKKLHTFLYQHYDDDKQRIYLCTELTPTNNAPAPSSLTATFEERFEAI